MTGLTRLLRRPPAALTLHCAVRTYRCSRPRANTAPSLTFHLGKHKQTFLWEAPPAAAPSEWRITIG